MSIDLSPETERLVREEISSGHFRSVDDLIISGVHAWREKNGSTAATPETPPAAGEAMFKVDGLWVHQGQAEPDADWGGILSKVREERTSDFLKASF